MRQVELLEPSGPWPGLGWWHQMETQQDETVPAGCGDTILRGGVAEDIKGKQE